MSQQHQQPLRLFDLTMIVVSFVIGMGIFKTPVNVAREAGSVEIFFLAWIIGGVIALSGALTYAEIGSRYPVMGGYYKIFSYCYHPSLAFGVNGIILISNAASVAAVALVGAEYIGNVALSQEGNTEAARMWIAIICIALFYGVNLLGLKMSAIAQNILMLFKLGLVFLVISALFFAPDANVSSTVESIANPQSWSDIGRALGVCLIAASFTYGGYQQSINFGAEVKQAHRIMPKAIVLGIGLILVLYMLVNFAYYRVIGFEALGNSQSIAAIMASKVFPENGFQIVSWLFFFSVLGYVNVMLMANPRVMFAMSEEGTLPKVLQYRHPKTDVMTVSLTIFTILTVITLFYAKTFDTILNYVMFLDCIGMATSAATIFILRRRQVQPEGQKIYKIPLYPILPIFYILAYIFITASIFNKDPQAVYIGLLIFAGFIGVYFLSQYLKKK